MVHSTASKIKTLVIMWKMVGRRLGFLIRFANRKAHWSLRVQAFVSVDDRSSRLLCLFLTYADFALVTVIRL